MYDVLDIIENIEGLYENNNAFEILKDYERVFDELDIYVYENWKHGELISGPHIERHWITCTFMWPESHMPDPAAAERLLSYDCKIKIGKSSLVQPRKIRKPDDIRPGTKKGKLDRTSIWVVEIQVPKALIKDMYSGYIDRIKEEPAQEVSIPKQSEPADQAAGGMMGGDMAGGDMAGGDMAGGDISI